MAVLLYVRLVERGTELGSIVYWADARVLMRAATVRLMNESIVNVVEGLVVLDREEAPGQ